MTLKLAKILLPVIVLLLAVAGYRALIASKPERPRPQLTEKTWRVEAITAAAERRAPVIRLYGRIESPGRLRAAAPGGGVVARVHVRNGARVAEGDALVTLDERDFSAALLQAEAELRDYESQIDELEVRHRANLAALETEQRLLALAEQEVERLAKLKRQNLSADSALSSARAELGRQQLALNTRELEVDSYPAKLKTLRARRDRARATVDEARLARQRANLSAPFDAIVSEVEVAAGDRVSLGQVLLTLYPLADLEIRAHLPANYIASVRRALAAGSRLTARVANRADLGEFPVERLAGEAEATGIDLYLSAANAAERLRSGDLLALDLELPAEEDVFAVPFQAIYGNSRIYKIVDDRLQAVDVDNVGQSRDAGGRVSVLIRATDIADGDRIAVTHLPNAVSGLRVVTGAERPAGTADQRS